MHFGSSLQIAQAHILSARGRGPGDGARYLSLAHDARFTDKALELHLKASTGRPALFGLSPDAGHIPSAMPNMLVAYKNRRYIADDVMPVVNVGKRSDRWFEYPVETMQTIAKTALAGNRARPNEMSYGLNSSGIYSVTDHALIDFVSADEEANADAPLQPRLAATNILTNALQLAHEYRVASKVFNPANYGTNTTALAGGTRWDNAASDPIAAIEAARGAIFAGANVLVMGEQTWIGFRNNPNVIRYITGRPSTALGPTPALISEAFVAQALGLDAVIVGRAKYATSGEGDTLATDYIWGKSASLIRVDPTPSPRGTESFGVTFRFGGRSFNNQVIPDEIAGVRGGVWVKISHSDAEQVVGGANSGFCWTTAVS